MTYIEPTHLTVSTEQFEALLWKAAAYDRLKPAVETLIGGAGEEFTDGTFRGRRVWAADFDAVVEAMNNLPGEKA